MDEQPGLSDQYRMASPWPLFVALGLPVAEIGVLFGLFPVAVGGLLLFGGSIAGIVQESGYVERPWSVLAGLGGVLVVLGVALAVWQLDPLSVDGLVTALQGQGDPRVDGLVVRGVAVVVAGVLLALGGGVGRLLEREPA